MAVLMLFVGVSLYGYFRSRDTNRRLMLVNGLFLPLSRHVVQVQTNVQSLVEDIRRFYFDADLNPESSTFSRLVRDLYPYVVGRKFGEAENLLAKQETSDAALLRKMELEDKIAYSTVALQLYQDEAVKSVTLANLDSANYRTGFATQAWDSLVSGWHILEAILVFMLNLWPFILGGILVFVGWKKLGKKKIAI